MDIPPVTGDYTFYIASDNASVLFLSNDDDPTQMRAITRELESSFRREWRSPMAPEAGDLGKVSAPVRLEAGRDVFQPAEAE